MAIKLQCNLLKKLSLHYFNLFKAEQEWKNFCTEYKFCENPCRHQTQASINLFDDISRLNVNKSCKVTEGLIS